MAPEFKIEARSEKWKKKLKKKMENEKGSRKMENEKDQDINKEANREIVEGNSKRIAKRKMVNENEASKQSQWRLNLK